MDDINRFKLLGNYRTPRFKYGDVVSCAIFGDVKIVGLTDARIPWPKGRSGKCARHVIALYGDLAEAVKRESAQAIRYWFGVGETTVTRWRQALGAERRTTGTSALHGRWVAETVQSDKAHRKRMRTIIAAKRTRAKQDTCRKPSKAEAPHVGHPPGPPWTAAEEQLLGTMKDKDVAVRTGRTVAAVSGHRFALGVPAFVQRSPRIGHFKWTPAKNRLLGTIPDGKLAAKLGCTLNMVLNQRRRLGIKAFCYQW